MNFVKLLQRFLRVIKRIGNEDTPLYKFRRSILKKSSEFLKVEELWERKLNYKKSKGLR